MPRYMGGVFWGFLFVRLFFQSLMRAVHDVGKKICLERFYGLTDCHTSEKPTDTRSCGWILLPTPPFQHCHRLIQDCGQNTEDHDGHDHEIQLEDLAAVDDG